MALQSQLPANIPPVPNIPLQVAAALRYTNANGDIVSVLYPNDYLSLTGSATGNLVIQYQGVQQILTTYQNTLNSLQSQITAIQTSGATNIPQVNGACLNNNTIVPMNVATQLLISNTCNYNAVLGTPSALTQGVLAENSAILNTLPAFSQNSVMAGLAGWIPIPYTVGDTLNNLWLASNDARTGIQTALSAITPTCAQVLVNFAVTYPGYSSGFNFYFNGYTFIPAGYTDNSSNLRISDTIGGLLVASFDIVSLSTLSSPLHLSTSGSTLSPIGPYTIQVNSNVKNVSTGSYCEKQLVVYMTSGATTVSSSGTIQVVGSSGCCPDIGLYNAQFTSGSTTITINGLGYTPSFANTVGLDAYTTQVINGRFGYMSFFSSGFTINLTGTYISGTLNFKYISYR